MLRVLVADDQDLFRGGFAMILDGHDDITVVGEAADGAEAVAKAVVFAYESGLVVAGDQEAT